MRLPCWGHDDSPAPALNNCLLSEWKGFLKFTVSQRQNQELESGFLTPVSSSIPWGEQYCKGSTVTHELVRNSTQHTTHAQGRPGSPPSSLGHMTLHKPIALARGREAPVSHVGQVPPGDGAAADP